MRRSSHTSTVTSQVSPSHWNALTPSGSYPVSSASVSDAERASSRAVMRSPSPSSSATLASHPSCASLEQTLDQHVLGARRLFLVDRARLPCGVDVEELTLDRALVVEVPLRLLEHLL